MIRQHWFRLCFNANTSMNEFTPKAPEKCGKCYICIFQTQCTTWYFDIYHFLWNGLRRVPQNPIADNSMLIWVRGVWCNQSISHYLRQSWPYIYNIYIFIYIFPHLFEMDAITIYSKEFVTHGLITSPSTSMLGASWSKTTKTQNLEWLITWGMQSHLVE